MNEDRRAKLEAHGRAIAAGRWGNLTPGQLNVCGQYFAAEWQKNFPDGTPREGIEFGGEGIIYLMNLERESPACFRAVPDASRVESFLIDRMKTTGNSQKDLEERMLISRRCARLNPDERLALLPIEHDKTVSAQEKNATAETGHRFSPSQPPTATDEQILQKIRGAIGDAQFFNLTGEQKATRVKYMRLNVEPKPIPPAPYASEMAAKGLTSDQLSPAARIGLMREKQAAARAAGK